MALRMHIGRMHSGSIKNGKQGKPKANVRTKLVRRQPAGGQEVTVNYCPQCGCNMHAVATGLALAAQLRKEGAK